MRILLKSGKINTVTLLNHDLYCGKSEDLIVQKDVCEGIGTTAPLWEILTI